MGLGYLNLQLSWGTYIYGGASPIGTWGKGYFHCARVMDLKIGFPFWSSYIHCFKVAAATGC